MMKKFISTLLIVTLMLTLAACGSNTTSIENTNDTTNNEALSTDNTDNSNAVEEEKISFTLVAGEKGEYGELFTINKGTEFEETYYVYRVPVGTYTVTNVGKYMNQFNVYGDEIHVTEEGWEEPAETFYVKVLDIGKSDTCLLYTSPSPRD